MGEVLLEGETVGGYRIEKFCVALQIGSSALNGILDGVADSLKDAFLIVEDDTTHAKRTSREHILGLVIDKYGRAGVSSGVVEYESVEPKVGFSLSSVGRDVDFVEQRPVCRFSPEIFIVGTGDVGHGVYLEPAIRPVLQLANEIEHLVI